MNKIKVLDIDRRTGLPVMRLWRVSRMIHIGLNRGTRSVPGYYSIHYNWKLKR